MQPPGPREVHTFDNGVMVYADQLWEEQRRRYALRNVHEAEEEDLFVAAVAALPAQGLFVSIGAGIGYYLLLARRLAPRLMIIAYEPLAAHRRYLEENVRLNGLPPDAFQVYPQAVAATDGEALLREQGYGSRLAQAADPAPPRGAAGDPAPPGYARVETLALDTLVGRLGRPVDLLQMDVQGWEAAVLWGGAQALAAGRIAAILIGTHGAPAHQECLALLGRHGYRIAHDTPQPRHQPDGIILAHRGDT